jgi:hypothetical protein
MRRIIIFGVLALAGCTSTSRDNEARFICGSKKGNQFFSATAVRDQSGNVREYVGKDSNGLEVRVTSKNSSAYVCEGKDKIAKNHEIAEERARKILGSGVCRNYFANGSSDPKELDAMWCEGATLDLENTEEAKRKLGV